MCCSLSNYRLLSCFIQAFHVVMYSSAAECFTSILLYDRGSEDSAEGKNRRMQDEGKEKKRQGMLLLSYSMI